MFNFSRRTHSFIWGGIAAALLIAVGIFGCISNQSTDGLFLFIVLGAIAFTFVSCLILDNNFIGEIVVDIWSWGFVKLPGLIFTLDLDGIIWLITVKLLFWILGIILAILTGALALVVGAFLSVFVYPFALYTNIKKGESEDI